MDSNLRVMPQIFDWISVGALTGPLKEIHFFVPKSLQCSFGCVLQVVVMLKGELPSQFQLSCRGQQVFLWNFSVFCSIFPSILTSAPVPADAKHPHYMMLPPVLYSWDGVLWVMCCVGFAPNVISCISAKKFHLAFVRPQNFLPHGFRISEVVCCKPQIGLKFGFFE